MTKTIGSIKTEGNITTLDFTPTLKELRGLVEIKFESEDFHEETGTLLKKHRLMQPVIVEGMFVTHVCEWKCGEDVDYEIASYGTNDEVFNNKEIESGYEVDGLDNAFDKNSEGFSYTIKEA